MRSVIAVSVCVCISSLVACGGSPEAGDGETTSTASAAVELSQPPAHCKHDHCFAHPLPGAFVSDSTDGPFRALVLSDARCQVEGASLNAFCFFGETSENDRIDGQYLAIGDEIALLYRVGRTSIVLSRYRYDRAGSSLQLSTVDTNESVESMITVESWCQGVADCRDQPLVPGVCPRATFAKATCEDALCVTACDSLSSPFPVAEPSSVSR